MADPIDRQAAIDFIDAGHLCNPNEPRWSDNEIVNFLKSRPSAHGDAEFISWLLDEIWDEEMWELNYRAFPELLCRRLARLGYLKEEGGKYVRLDKQTGGD